MALPVSAFVPIALLPKNHEIAHDKTPDIMTMKTEQSTLCSSNTQYIINYLLTSEPKQKNITIENVFKYLHLPCYH